MALYIAEGSVYVVGDDGACHGADVSAKDKVVETRTLESVTVSPRDAEVALPKGARPVTVDEMVAQLGLSEKNPCPFKGAEPKTAKARKEK